MAKEDKQDKQYEVKDKRRVNADGSLKEDAQPEAQEPVEESEETKAESEQAAPPQDEAKSAEPEEEMPPPDVYQTLQFVAGLLVEQAWQFMGLHLPPGRKEPVKDMAQAKIAIDTVIFLSDKLHTQLDEDGRKAIRSLISDLQLNYVQQGQ